MSLAKTLDEVPATHKARCPHCFAEVVVRPFGYHVVIRDEHGDTLCGECRRFFRVDPK